MTIARRLLVLMSIPLLVLMGLGFLSWMHLDRIEGRSRFLAENVTPSLGVLGHLGHSFIEMRSDVGGHLLTEDPEKRARFKQAFFRARDTALAYQRKYADTLLVDSQDRRLMNEFRINCNEWIANAEQVLILSTENKPDEAKTLFREKVDPTTQQLIKTLDHWIQYNEELGRQHVAAANESISDSRLEVLGAALGILLSVGLGSFLPVRSYVP